MKKLLKIILCITIVLSNFTPFFATNAKAAGNTYEVFVGYPSDDHNHLDKYDRSLGTYSTYSEALNQMNSYPSTELAVAYIKKNGIVVNAAYGIAQQDVINGVEQKGDVTRSIYSTPEAAHDQNAEYTSNWLTYIAGSWGNDSILLDYDDTYDVVKVKISGIVGYVKRSQVLIKPISRYYGATFNYSDNFTKITINTDSCLNIRSSAGIKDDNLTGRQTCKGDKYNYYANATEKKDGYIWYKIGDNKYIATEEDKNWVIFDNKLKFDTFYFSYQKELIHQKHMGAYKDETQSTIGTAPFWYSKPQTKTYYFDDSSTRPAASNPNDVASNRRYYSFDGHYFYKDLITMIKDYKANNYNSSINKDNPYFAYFQYAPSRAISNYSAAQFDNVTNNKTAGENSVMRGIGYQFVQASTVYGVSALKLYSAAAQESNYGRSAIARDKNNLFGQGASDDNPYNNAIRYNSTQDSINAYARSISIGGYATLDYIYYGGTHFGDKASGQMKFYASDPYSGESKASVSYDFDKVSGGNDNYSNTLGVTLKNTLINVYAEPNSSSRVIYTPHDYMQKPLVYSPFVVTDKVLGSDGKYYYRVYTDITLTKNREVSKSDDDMYNYEYCYGYIKEDDLYVQNHQPLISATNKTIKQYDSFDPKKDVTANDYEDGDITSSLTYEGKYKVNEPGTYNITYKVSDSSKFSASKKITLTVEPTDAPIITADDIVISQYKEFDLMTGVTVTDKKDGDITSSVHKDGIVDVNTTGEYIITYTSTNTLGLTTIKNRKITVVTNEKPIITINNTVAYLNKSFNYLDNVTASDKEDGDLTSGITYKGSVDTTKLGEYEITYKVKDLDNQETTKTVIITVEEKQYQVKTGKFYLRELSYNEDNSKVNFIGYLAIKNMNSKKTDSIEYDIIFENQYNGSAITMSLSRLLDKIPFDPSEKNVDYSGAWFSEELDLSSLPSGDYTIYVRVRNGDYEAKELLSNVYFCDKLATKFNIDDKGFRFKVNYIKRAFPVELFVRDGGLITDKLTPTNDNMYNQVNSIKLNGTKLDIIAVSHNVGGNYASNIEVTRKLLLENIKTFDIAKEINVGSITNGPYAVSLKVSDGFNKTRVWYKTSIDLSDLEKGTYSIQVRTTTGDVDDYGELYDVMFKNDLNTSQTINIDDKTITIKRNEEKRFRVEIVVE